jgi:hypothetical protein
MATRDRFETSGFVDRCNASIDRILRLLLFWQSLLIHSWVTPLPWGRLETGGGLGVAGRKKRCIIRPQFQEEIVKWRDEQKGQ